MSEKLEELISLLYQDRLTQYGKGLLIENIEKLQKENEELLEIKVSTSAHNRILELEKENRELKAEMKDGVIAIKLYALQTENEKLKKIIDLMANHIATNDSNLCQYLDMTTKCKYYAGENGKTCDECIKQYFNNKAKEVE